MPRNMSFTLTTEQMRQRQKTVTRRTGWATLKEGDVLCAVEKSQGLKKGEKIKRICLIRVVSTHWEPLENITQADCVKEGFPKMSPVQFVDMFCKASHWESWKDVNRIEFEYI